MPRTVKPANRLLAAIQRATTQGHTQLPVFETSPLEAVLKSNWEDPSAPSPLPYEPPRPLPQMQDIPSSLTPAEQAAISEELDLNYMNLDTMGPGDWVYEGRSPEPQAEPNPMPLVQTPGTADQPRQVKDVSDSVRFLKRLGVKGL